MAIKTFTVGEVLTTSDTNTYLANSGLVYVTSATIGSGVTTIPVSSCFSSTYDNYLIQVYGYGTSVDSVLWMTINGSTGSTYQSVGYYMSYGSTTLNGSGGAATANGFRLAENSSSGNNNCTVTLFRPNLVSATAFVSTGQNAGYANQYQGKDTNAASSTGFTLNPSSGTITGGTVTVYGYRKA